MRPEPQLDTADRQESYVERLQRQKCAAERYLAVAFVLGFTSGAVFVFVVLQIGAAVLS